MIIGGVPTVNRHLMNPARRPIEQLTVEQDQERLLGRAYRSGVGRTDAALLADAAKIGCSTSMLVCLHRPLRLPYPLGAASDLPGRRRVSRLTGSAFPSLPSPGSIWRASATSAMLIDCRSPATV